MSSFFRPEFVNRIDEIVRFRSLSEADLARIVEIQLETLRQRLAVRRISLAVTDGARAVLASKGFDPAFGARPLRRLIQKEVGDQLALLLLEGKVSDGDTVTVETDGAGGLLID